MEIQQQIANGNSNTANSLQEVVRDRWNSWISLNASLSSRWWYATVHVLTATIGAGVLSLHTTMAPLGWAVGIILLSWILALSLICYSRMVEMHEIGNVKFDRYKDLGKHMLGRRRGFWLVFPFQTSVTIVVDIIYTMVATNSLKHVFQTDQVWPFVIGFGCLQLIISQLPDLTSITCISVIGAVTAVGYSTLAWIALIINISYKDSPAPSPTPGSAPTPDVPLVYRIFAALGQLAFTCTQNIALEIQATIPSTTLQPSKIAMWRGVLLAYLIISLCYFPVAISGYHLFGRDPDKFCKEKFPNSNPNDCDNLLTALNEPWGLIVVANLMVFLHMCSSFQVYAMPLFSSLEYYTENICRISVTVRLLLRSLYVVGITLVAGFASQRATYWEATIGGIAFMQTSYLLPCILWYKYKKPRNLSIEWLGIMFCIVFAIVMAVTSTVGSIIEWTYQ